MDRHLLGGGGYDQDNENSLAWLGEQAIPLEWFAFSVSTALFFLYARERYYNNSCPWEVLCVAFVEAFHYLIAVNFHNDEAAAIKLANGTKVYWIRYAGWLLTCPVILIHLSHTAEETDSVLTHKMLYLLTSNQAMIVFGVTASVAAGATRTWFFIFGSIAFAVLCSTAANIYTEALRVYPMNARLTLRFTAGLFFISWSMYPLFWLLGPDGFSIITNDTSTALHAITDLFAKNLWGYLMFRVREYNLEGVAHQMGITAAEYIRKRRVAIKAMDSHFEEWTQGCIAGDNKEVTIQLNLRTPKFKEENKLNKPNTGPDRKSSILGFTPSSFAPRRGSECSSTFMGKDTHDKLPDLDMTYDDEASARLRENDMEAQRRTWANSEYEPSQTAYDRVAQLKKMAKGDNSAQMLASHEAAAFHAATVVPVTHDAIRTRDDGSRHDPTSMERLAERMARLKEGTSAPSSPKYNPALMAAADEMRRAVAEGKELRSYPFSENERASLGSAASLL